MAKHLVFLAILASVGWSHATARADKPTWTTVELGRLHDVETRLRVLDEATAGDLEWIGFEVEHVGEGPMPHVVGRFRIEGERRDAETGRPMGSGPVSSGQFEVTDPDLPLQKVAFRRASDQGTSFLGRPVNDRVWIRATVHLEMWRHHGDLVAVPPGDRLDVQRPGLPFEFHWSMPGPAGIERMRQRLAAKLGGPYGSHVDSYVVDEYLKWPEVASAVSAEELLALLDSGRLAIQRPMFVRALARHYPEALVGFVEAELKTGGSQVLQDLVVGNEAWSDAFVEPLVALHEANPMLDHGLSPMTVLGYHREDWNDNEAIRRRLVAGLLKAAEQLPPLTDRLSGYDQFRWRHLFRGLTIAPHRDALEFAVPLLDDPTWVYSRDDLLNDAAPWLGPPVVRVCDLAHDVIASILELDRDRRLRMFNEAGYDFRSYDRTDDLDQMLADSFEIRDQMIAELRELLRSAPTPP